MRYAINNRQKRIAQDAKSMANTRAMEIEERIEELETEIKALGEEYHQCLRVSAYAQNMLNGVIQFNKDSLKIK